MSDYNDLIRGYYEDKSLSEESLVRILSLSSPRSTKPSLKYLLPVAAALLLGFFSLFAFLEYQRESFRDRVIAEIAMNHSKELSVEFSTGDYGELSAMMDKLDFSILPAQGLFSSNYDLLGGRYCSIQGALAAQLKLKSRESGEVHTLYIARLSDALRSVGSRQASRQGVNIELFTSGGVFMGLAEGEQP